MNVYKSFSSFIYIYIYIYIYILLGIQSTLLGRLYRKREQLIENSWKFTLSFQSRYFAKTFILNLWQSFKYTAAFVSYKTILNLIFFELAKITWKMLKYGDFSKISSFDWEYYWQDSVISKCIQDYFWPKIFVVVNNKFKIFCFWT